MISSLIKKLEQKTDLTYEEINQVMTDLLSGNTTHSLNAAFFSKLAEKENLNADVFGPLAFDNSISKKSANIKGIKNSVAGNVLYSR